MHITLEADYAVRTVYCLLKDGGRMEAKRISEKTGTTLRFTLKLLRKLVKCGIAKSYKGTGGGYEINRAPENINLREVIEAVEGPYMLSRCLCDDYVCTNTVNEGPCLIKRVFGEISDEVRTKLESVTFDRFMNAK